MRFSRELNCTNKDTIQVLPFPWSHKYRTSAWEAASTLSSILSYINLQPGSGFDPCTIREHLFFGWALLIMSSSITSSSCSFIPRSVMGSELILNWTTNLFVRCPKGVIRLDCLLDERRLPFALCLESLKSSYKADGLSVGVSRRPSFRSSCSSFKILHRKARLYLFMFLPSQMWQSINTRNKLELKYAH